MKKSHSSGSIGGGKVVLYRDTGSVDPGSGSVFGCVSGSEIHIFSIAYAIDTFPNMKDTFCGSLDPEPVSCICIADPNLMCRAQPCQLSRFHSISIYDP